MDEILVTDGVLKVLQKTNPRKATGPDCIPACILKNYAAELAPILTLISNMSLKECTVAEDWKHANVIAFHKKGAWHDAANYRPVSLTSLCCKLLEHVKVSSTVKHHEKYRKSLYFRVFFILRFSDHRPLRGDQNSQCTTFSYVNSTCTNVSWEPEVHEWSNPQILTKIKFMQIIVNLQFNILNDCEHGFRVKRSCETQIFTLYHELASSLDRNIQTDMVILGFSKAFHHVPEEGSLLWNSGQHTLVDYFIPQYYSDDSPSTMTCWVLLLSQ